MPEKYGVYASGLTDASGTPFASIYVRRGTKDTPYFELKQVYVGDSLPQGNVTEITPKGIRVIPDEGDEYLLPVGSGARVDYSGRKKTPDRSYLDGREAIDLEAGPISSQIEFPSDEDADAYASLKNQMKDIMGPFYEMMRNPEILSAIDEYNADRDVLDPRNNDEAFGRLVDRIGEEYGDVDEDALRDRVENTPLGLEPLESGKYPSKPLSSGLRTAMDTLGLMETREPLPYIEPED